MEPLDYTEEEDQPDTAAELPPVDAANIPPSSPEEILARSYSVDPGVAEARQLRDKQIADATVNQGITELATALASQGRVKPSTAVFDAIKKNAQQHAEEAGKDVSLRQKTISDYIKGQAAQKKEGEAKKFRDDGRELRKAELEESRKFREGQAGEMNQNRAFNRASEFRKEYSGIPTSKDSQDVATSYYKIVKAAEKPSAAGDIALLTGFMKLIDPGSTVREGEFKTAQFAGSVPDRLKAFYNQILSGQRLDDTQRADFVNQAKTLAVSQRDTQKLLEDQYRSKATQLKLNPDEVITDYFAGIPLDDQKNHSPSAIGNPEDAKALAWANANPNDPRAAKIKMKLGK